MADHLLARSLVLLGRVQLEQGDLVLLVSVLLGKVSAHVMSAVEMGTLLASTRRLKTCKRRTRPRCRVE
jgi:hypothetical protein